MKKATRAVQGLFLFVVGVSFAVAYAGTTEDSKILNEKETMVQGLTNHSSARYMVSDSLNLEQCKAVYFKAAEAADTKYIEEVEKAADKFKAGKINREELKKSLSDAKMVWDKAYAVFTDVFTKCCMDETLKAKAAADKKSKQQ